MYKHWFFIIFIIYLFKSTLKLKCVVFFAWFVERRHYVPSRKAAMAKAVAASQMAGMHAFMIFILS